MKRRIFFVAAFVALLLAACVPPESSEPAPEPTDAVGEAASPTVTAAPPTATPVTPTPVPPTETATALPPTETPTETASPVPEPVVIGETTAADGCTLVTFNPAGWSPLFTAYKTGADPFFHIHTNDDGFFVGFELYTVYGPGWTGQTGVFETDCTANGICVYVAPDGTTPYLATAGEIEIESLSQTDGTLDFPVNLTLRDVTFEPSPGSGGAGCYHVDELEIEVEE